MAIVALLAGTWGRDRVRPRWFEAGSPFVQGLEAAGHTLPPRKPTWSTELDGLWARDGTWEDLGRYLACYVELTGVTRWIAHSHAGQGILYSAAKGVRLDVVILVGTPVRDTWTARYARARRHIRRLVHLYSPVDRWQRWGAIRLVAPSTWIRAPRIVPGAVPIRVPGASHSGLLDPGLWTGRGWWRLLG